MADLRRPASEGGGEKGDVLTPMVSMAKMDVDELRRYTERISAFLRTPDVVALRICECCVDVKIT